MKEDIGKFSFTKQKYTSNTNVWYDGILIGELSLKIQENPNIDWPKYRADKTLKLDPKVRWLYTWKAHAASNMTTIGSFENKEDAASAILKAHRVKYHRDIEN